MRFPGLDDVTLRRRLRGLTVPTSTELDDALARASEENDLPTYYRACVRPLLKMAEAQWPTCCGASCDPCTDQLIRVARRVRALLER